MTIDRFAISDFIRLIPHALGGSRMRPLCPVARLTLKPTRGTQLLRCTA
jgi:hypothetical protein